MRTSGFLLGLLFLHATLLSYRAGAQVTPPAVGSPPSHANSATEQTPIDVQTPSSSQTDEDSSSGREHKLHLRLGTISLGAGYSRLSGPAYYPYEPRFYPLAWEYSPFSLPYWGPAFPHDFFAYGSDKGEVKLAVEPKTAEVYLNQAYAGTADHLRSIWLEPGAYDLSLRAAGRDVSNRRIYVLSGKSVKIAAKLVTNSPKPDKVKDKP
jgi:hypothetical protein